MYLKIKFTLIINNMIINYTCPRCCYTTNRTSDIKKHIQKKKLCKLVKHNIIPLEYKDIILNNNFDMINEINKLKKEIVELKEQLKLITIGDNNSNNNNNTINNTNTTNNTNNITININAFDNPNISFLTDKDYKQCINRIINSVPELIKKIHFNPKHPENHNMYVSNKRNDEIHCYDGNKWILGNKNELVNDLIQRNEDILSDWIEDASMHKDNKLTEKFEKYLKLREEDDVLDKIIKKVKLEFYNNKNTILKTKKQPIK